MRPLKIGYINHILQTPGTQETPSWESIRSTARQAEDAGCDAVWIYDELVYNVDRWGGVHGCWECVAITGAVAEATKSIDVGTWVLSALRRNPGLTAKVAATLDEISGGRFVFGLGAGHLGGGAREFGYPTDKVVGRYSEALDIIVPLLRGKQVDFEGEYHSTDELVQVPTGPRPGGIPLMLAGHGPRTIALAVRHADIWSAFATTTSLPEGFADTVDLVNRMCLENGRDPGSLERSAGVVVEFGEGKHAERAGFGVPLSGSIEQIADAIHEFAGLGFTSLEIQTLPGALKHLMRSNAFSGF